MTLAASTRRRDATGNGSTATYSYSFKIFDDDDLLVIVRKTSTGVETTLTKTTDYTVSGVGETSGGNVVLVDANQDWLDASGFLATGYTITILGNRGYLQDTSIRNQGPLYPNVLEDEYDKQVVLLQQLAEKCNRAITLRKTSTETGIEFTGDALADSEGEVIVVNSDGDGIEPSGTTISQIATYASNASASASAAATSASSASTSASAASTSATAAASSASSAAASAASIVGVTDGDKGDITVSSTGTVWTVDNDAITYAKMQNVSATDRLLGRDTASAGNVEELTVGGGLEFTGSGGIQRSALTGDVTAAAGSNSTTIANDAVTYAKMQNVSATDKILGRSTSGAGDVEEIDCTAAGRALLDDASAGDQRTTLGLGTIATQASSNVTITGGSVTGITDLVVADGGTGVSSLTAYAVICGGTTATGAVQSISSVGTSGHVLTSNGAGALPTFQAAAGANAVAAMVTGNPGAIASNTPIIFPTVTHDTNSAYSAVTGQFTAPSNGYYMIRWYLTGDSTNRLVSAYVNGSKVIDASNNDTIGSGWQGGCAIVRCPSGQTIDIRASNTLTGNASDNMGIAKLGSY